MLSMLENGLQTIMVNWPLVHSATKKIRSYFHVLLLRSLLLKNDQDDTVKAEL